MIKQDVKIYGVRPEMVYCKIHIMAVLAHHNVQYIPTSCIRDVDRGISLHPEGFAEDIRTRHIMGAREVRESMLNQIVTELKNALPQCDFVLEHFEKAKEHIHWEFDPKNDPVFQLHKKIYKQTGEWPDEID